MKKGSTKETMETDQLVITHLGDKPVKFYTRSKPGADITCSDEIVIREMFVENVYSAFADDFKDTGVVVDIGAIAAPQGVARNARRFLIKANVRASTPF